MTKLPNFHACFVCGDRNAAGLGVRFRTDGERVYTTFTARKPHMGFHQTTHGGILATLLDETMGWAPVLVNRRFCVTVELSVKYIQPAPLGTELTVAGWVTGGRRRIWEAEGEITDNLGTVYARGKGRYMLLGAEKTREVLEYLTFDEECVSPDLITDTN